MKKVVMVIEDDPDIRSNMIEFLESEDYTPVTANDGKEALNLLSKMETLPSAIILDYLMPVMGGAEFRAEQEKRPRIANIPVILVSAVTDIEVKRLQVGALTFIKKPVDIDELSKLLKKF